MPNKPKEASNHLIPVGKLGQLCELSRLMRGTPDPRRAQGASPVGAMTLTLADLGSIQLFQMDGSGTVCQDRREGLLEGTRAQACDQLFSPWVAQGKTLLPSDHWTVVSGNRIRNRVKEIGLPKDRPEPLT